MAQPVSAPHDADAQPGPSNLWAVAAQDPDRVALLGEGVPPVTYGELVAQANRVSRVLAGMGLRPGDAVAEVLGNRPETLAVVLGALQIGLRVVPVSHHLAAPEVSYLVADSEAAVLIVHESYEALGAALPVDPARPMARLSFGRIAGYEPIADLLAAAPDDAPPGRQMGQLTYYTSGTTGRPRAVERPPGPVVAPESAGPGAAGYLSMFGITPGERDQVQVVACPMYHAAPLGWSMFGLHLGHQLAILERFSPEALLASIERHRVTYGFLVPTMFHRLLGLPEEVRRGFDHSSIKTIVHAAAPCPVQVKQRMFDWWGPVFWEFYAGTEGGGVTVAPEEWLAHPGTVGRQSWPGTEVGVLDDAGVECPPGEAGTIWFVTESNFHYRHDPEKTERARHDGRFTLGDIGYKDAEGWLYLLDRRSDLIITGGVNVYPAEIEAVLLTHPDVADAAVIGVADEEWGHVVVAVIETVDGRRQDDDLRAELMQLCAEQLARLKHPRRIEFRDHLPRRDNGKLYRRILRDELEQERQVGLGSGPGE